MPKVKKNTKMNAKQQYKLEKAKMKERRREIEARNEPEITALKLAAKAKKYGLKQDRKIKVATAASKTKTVARSSAAASAAMTSNLSTIEASRSAAEIAKYNALIKGNYDGGNAVDPEKTGGNGNTNPQAREYYGGW